MSGAVRFLADTGAAVSCLHPKESIPPRLPVHILRRGELSGRLFWVWMCLVSAW